MTAAPGSDVPPEERAMPLTPKGRRILQRMQEEDGEAKRQGRLPRPAQQGPHRRRGACAYAGTVRARQAEAAMMRDAFTGGDAPPAARMRVVIGVPWAGVLLYALALIVSGMLGLAMALFAG